MYMKRVVLLILVGVHLCHPRLNYDERGATNWFSCFSFFLLIYLLFDITSLRKCKPFVILSSYFNISILMVKVKIISSNTFSGVHYYLCCSFISLTQCFFVVFFFLKEIEQKIFCKCCLPPINYGRHPPPNLQVAKMIFVRKRCARFAFTSKYTHEYSHKICLIKTHKYSTTHAYYPYICMHSSKCVCLCVWLVS